MSATGSSCRPPRSDLTRVLLHLTCINGIPTVLAPPSLVRCTWPPKCQFKGARVPFLAALLPPLPGRHSFLRRSPVGPPLRRSRANLMSPAGKRTGLPTYRRVGGVLFIWWRARERDETGQAFFFIVRRIRQVFSYRASSQGDTLNTPRRAGHRGLSGGALPPFALTRRCGPHPQRNERDNPPPVPSRRHGPCENVRRRHGEAQRLLPYDHAFCRSSFVPEGGLRQPSVHRQARWVAGRCGREGRG